MRPGISPAAQWPQIPHGTAFPVSPVVNDHYYRDDLLEEFVCVATGPSVWHGPQTIYQVAYQNGMASSAGFHAMIPSTWTAAYLEAVLIDSQIGTTNDATNYWQFGAQSVDNLGNLVALGTATFTRSTITAISIAANAVVTTLTPHGYQTGNTKTIAGTNSTPNIDGARVVTVLTPTTFSVPVTTSGTGNTGTTADRITDVCIHRVDVNAALGATIRRVTVYISKQGTPGSLTGALALVIRRIEP
jgi:hypothetical protein